MSLFYFQNLILKVCTTIIHEIIDVKAHTVWRLQVLMLGGRLVEMAETMPATRILLAKENLHF